MISVKRAALSLGALFGVLHFVWALLVSLTAGGIVQWAMSLHGMRANFVYLPLDVVNLLIGTVLVPDRAAPPG